MRSAPLTETEQRELEAHRAEWLEVGLSTEPADWERAERGVAACYRAIGEEPPGLVLHVPSPLGACIGGVLGGQLRGQLGGQLRGQLRDQLWDQLGDQLGVQLRGQLGVQLRGQLRGQLWDQLGDQLGDAWWGQWDAPYVAWWLFGLKMGVVLDDRLSEGLRGWEDVARSCGWWFPRRGAVILCDRPSVIAKDDEGRLHRGDGPALAFRDGYGLWAIHGVRVTQQIAERPETLRPEEIVAEPNAEVRRVMVERFGADRLMAALRPEVRHEDVDRLGAVRRLLRVEMADDEPLCMVEVRNSTPEPDGSWHNYLLRVPPEVETCEAAVAWTFGQKRLRLVAET